MNNTTISSKAKVLYNQFSNAPIFEMVQFLVDENVDAQLLHQIKVIDNTHHKNMHVRSYTDKVCANYERVCKTLVTYPSLDFKESKYKIKKKKHEQFMTEYFGEAVNLPIEIVDRIVNIGNMAMVSVIDANEAADKIIRGIITAPQDIVNLTIFLKEISGEDYGQYIKSICSDL